MQIPGHIAARESIDTQRTSVSARLGRRPHPKSEPVEESNYWMPLLARDGYIVGDSANVKHST